jgi:hypothetical protein
MVDASNAECTQSVFKFMSADTDGDGCNVAQTFFVRLVERARVVWQREYKQLYEHCRGIVLDFV